MIGICHCMGCPCLSGVEGWGADQLVCPITATTLWDSPDQTAQLLSARKPSHRIHSPNTWVIYGWDLQGIDLHGGTASCTLHL